MAKTEIVELPKINLKKMTITCEGISPVIVHRWSEKAKKQMLDKQMKKAKQAKEAKDPQRDFEQSLYKLNGDCVLPTIWFKLAAVNACSYVEGITKVLARGAFYIEGEYVKIEGSAPKMREDMVKIAMGTADIRYRGQFDKWKVALSITYNAGVLSSEQIINLLNIGGFSIGVGEWRPQRNGDFGRFKVV